MKFISKSRCMISRRHSSRGFTLLEIVLAVAMMVIVSLIVYQGFMSSLQYSSNTAQFEKTAQEAFKEVNSAFSAGFTPGDDDGGLYLKSGTYSQVIRVNKVADTQSPTLIIGDPNYDESGIADVAATNRKAFSYVTRPCTNGCGGTMLYYKQTVGGVTKIIAKCSLCGYVDNNYTSYIYP